MGSHLDKYLVPRLGAGAVAAIDERIAQEVITHLSEVEYKWPNGASRKLSSKTIRNIVGVLKQILGRKVWRDWSDLAFPADAVKKEQRWCTETEMRQIVNAATGVWRVLFATLAGSGMRIGEASALSVEDLDLAGGRISPAQCSEREGRHTEDEEGSPCIQRGARDRRDADCPPRRANDGPRVSDTNWIAILQRQREAQAERDPQ